MGVRVGQDLTGRVQAYYLRAPHFSDHSGYELAVRGLAETKGILWAGQQWPRRPAEGALERGLRERLTRTLARASQTAASRLAGSAEYSTGALALELSAILRMARSRDQVIHFLYAENACRLTPAFDGWRGHRVVATFHQTPELLAGKLRRPAYLGRLGAAVMLGRNQANFLGRYVPPERLHFIPHGVDTTYFRPGPPSERGDPPLCASVGGTLRDFQTLRDAANLLAARGVPVRYDLVARGDQLPYVAGLAGARVRTWVDDEEFLRLYQRADLFVLPLHDAVASNTLLEAMACGAPTVVTDAGAVRDYVDEGSVVFARRGDPRSLAEGMERLLRDPALAARLGAAARARAEALDVGAVAGQHRELYRSLLRLPRWPAKSRQAVGVAANVEGMWRR
jgi:glycosyltransferase involved in cell wall biosynthesis